MSNFPYSLAATVYFSTLVIALLVLGTHSVRSVVLTSLFLGALSQFVMQGDGRMAELHSNALAYVAMAFIVIAMILYVFP